MTRKRKKTKESDTDESELNELQETLDMTTERYGDVVTKGVKKKQPMRISTGIFMLDFSLLGGLPEGRISQIIGEKSAGKSTLMSKVVASVQAEQPDKEVVLLDIEHTYDAVWAGKLGINNDRITIIEPDTGEAAVDIADAVLGSKETSMLIIDSLAFMIPMAEAEASAEDNHMGRAARLFNELCRKVTNTTNHQRMRGHNPTTLFINQYRTNIGKMFGDNRTHPGGRAVEAACSVMIAVKNKEKIDKDDYGVERVAYNEHEFIITKNKLCNGPREGAYRLIRDYDERTGLSEGDIDNATTMIVYAKKFGFWQGAGKNQRLEFDDYNLKFGKQDEGILALNEDVDLYYALYYALLREQAIARGMPDDFVARFV